MVADEQAKVERGWWGSLVALLQAIPPVHLYSAGAAAAGGLASFLYACKRGAIRNNRYCRKAGLEIVGGSVVGFFVALPFHSTEVRVSVSFALGLCWSFAIQVLRKKITDICQAMLGTIGGPPTGDNGGGAS